MTPGEVSRAGGAHAQGPGARVRPPGRRHTGEAGRSRPVPQGCDGVCPGFQLSGRGASAPTSEGRRLLSVGAERDQLRGCGHLWVCLELWDRKGFRIYFDGEAGRTC